MNKRNDRFICSVKNNMILSFSISECRDTLEDLHEYSMDQDLYNTYGNSRSFTRTLCDSQSSRSIFLHRLSNIALIGLLTGSAIFSFFHDFMFFNRNTVVFILIIAYIAIIKDFLLARIISPVKHENMMMIIFMILSVFHSMICFFISNHYYPSVIESSSAEYASLGVGITYFYIYSNIISILICLVVMYRYIKDNEPWLFGIVFQFISLTLSLSLWYRDWSFLEDFSNIPKMHIYPWGFSMLFSLFWFRYFKRADKQDK